MFYKKECSICCGIHFRVYEFLYINSSSKNLTMEREILEQFLYASKLRFNEIEKALGVRSNKLNYHLQKLVSKGILVRIGDFYELSESSEYMIPYLSSKKHVLSVLLVHVGNSREAFLIERKKRPYRGKLSLPGGRLVMGESIEEGAVRIMKKFGVDAKFKGVKSVSLEHLEKKGKVVATYLLVYVTVSADVDLVDLKKNRPEIIESDYLLMTGDFGKRSKINIINSVV